MNLVKFLESSTKGVLNRTALIEDTKEVTYRELWENIAKFAQGLLDLKIKEGDRIAIILPNSVEYVFVFLAALKINAVAVPLNQHITAYELKQVIKNCNPAIFVTDNIFLKRLLPLDSAVSIENIVISSKRGMKDRFSERIVRIKDVLKDSGYLKKTFFAKKGTVASINYTYRGTGKPLGAMLSHGNYRYGICTYIKETDLKFSDKVLLAAPFSFIYSLIGVLIAPLLAGATIIIAKRVTPKCIINLIEAMKINVIANVPTFYSMILDSYRKHGGDLSSIYEAISGGSYLSLSLYERVKKEIGWEIRQGYGLTECLPVIYNPASGNIPGSLGKLSRYAKIKIKIVDELGRKKNTGDIGEICVKGKTVMLGYYNRPKQTAAVLRDGWLSTGDYGYFDKKGYLYMTGRKKQIAKVGGNMVDLEEVRNNILAFPGVVNANINIIEDELWGQLLAARIVVENFESFNVHQLKFFLRHRLSSYKIPRIQLEAEN